MTKTFLKFLTITTMIYVPLIHAKEVTIFHTNDIESVYEPIEAFWNPEIEYIGGIPQLSTLIKQEREKKETSFLFDAGDIFTGALSKKTQGRISFDLYTAMGYDALALGNHEFEYGWKTLREVMPRAPFPILNANIIYADTDITLTQPYTIVENNDVRIGVIGVMGVDAFLNTMMKKNRQGLDYLDPTETVQKYVDLIKDEVDLIVVLTHQNKTAPMQTDKENDPEVQRGFDEDYAMAGALKDVDLIIGGHSDNGLWEPVIHPDTGTVIAMTFGQGKYLGEIVFNIEEEKSTYLSGKLIPVVSNELTPDPKISQIINETRAAHPDLSEIVGKIDKFAFRSYYKESNIGNLIADILRENTGADIGMMSSGSIRYDINAGNVNAETLYNVYPFKDTIAVVEAPGSIVRELFEYSYKLNYGLVQASGIQTEYDLNKAEGERIVSININGEPLQDDKTYTIATYSYAATGGDGYNMLAKGNVTMGEETITNIIIDYFKNHDIVHVPDINRQINRTQ